MSRRTSVDCSSATYRNQHHRWMMLATAVGVIAAAGAIRYLAGSPAADARSPRTSATATQVSTRPSASAPLASPVRAKHQMPEHDVMALVNGQDISRPQLEKACVERYGEEVLESLVNKRLIEHHCRKRGIRITPAEIEAEVERMAKRFKLGREQWLELLANERGIGEQEYKRDILWPTLALRKLAANDLEPTEEELRKEYERTYGPSVRARIIVVDDEGQADKLQRQLAANPDDFARLAMNESIDVNSASIGGLIQPIRMHMGEMAIEQAAFALEPGEISAVIPIGGKFALLKCEGHVPARPVAFHEARQELEEVIREGKLREVAAEKFAQFQQTATVQNVYNDPELSQRMLGVVALVNGDPVTMAELSKEALLRHGEEVLEIEISHKLLEQALAAEGTTVTQQDLEAEIDHAAKLAGVVDPQGKPNTEKWVSTALEEQGVSYNMYIRDSVWPSAALKKITHDQVEVTNDDLQKGYEANYGERVRCRAIVLGSIRRAQDVWQKARSNQSMEYFGDLAEEYSIEPTSKALRGEVPPIRLHGGQPQLEEVAFEMQPGELSGVVQVGDKFVILKCEGRTDTQGIELAAVRDILMQDIYEKKLRIAMSQKFEAIRQQAQIDNYLAGTTQAPAKGQSGERQAARAGREGAAR